MVLVGAEDRFSGEEPTLTKGSFLMNCFCTALPASRPSGRAG